jgi:hypothetical protein
MTCNPDKLGEQERVFLRSLRARIDNPDAPRPIREECGQTERLPASVRYSGFER